MAVQISRQRAGPIHKPVEIGERCLLSDKLLGEHMIHLHGHRQYFPVVDLAQVEAAGESCANPMEPLPRAEAHGGLSSAWRWVPTSAATVRHRYWLIPFASVAPCAFLAGLVIPMVVLHCWQGRDRCMLVVKVKDKSAPWGASCFPHRLL